MMAGEWVRAIVTILAGSLAGGLTNTVAVWMLFHPHAPPKVGPWRLRFLHGAIPKNQVRLASAISRTIGNRLLSDQDLQEILQSPGFREAFEDRLDTLLATPLNQPWGSLADHLSPEALVQAEDVLHGIAEQVEGAVLDWIQSPAFEHAVDRALAGASPHILDSDRPLGDLLPDAWEPAVEQAISSYLPLAVDRLSRVLEDPATRVQVERILQDLLQRMLRDMKLHQRLVARLVMTDDALDRMVDTIEAEGAEQVARMLQAPEIQASLARGIRVSLQELLQKPVTEIFGHATDLDGVDVRRTLAQWLVRLAHMSVSGRGGANDDPGEAQTALVRATLRPWILGLLHQPLGVPARWLGAGGAARLSAALRDPLWAWLQAQVPHFLSRLDIQKRVEDKVLGYPTEELENLVRRVTDRELRLIVRLGYGLGAVIGVLLVLIHRFLPGG